MADLRIELVLADGTKSVLHCKGFDLLPSGWLVIHYKTMQVTYSPCALRSFAVMGRV